MIKNIIISGFLLCLLIAISIKLVDSSITFVRLGNPFLSFLNSCNYEFNRFTIAIPSIPKFDVEKLNSIDTITINNAWDALKAAITQVSLLNKILMGLLNLFNFIISIFNALISIINTALQLIEFCIIVIKNLIVFRDNLVASA